MAHQGQKNDTKSSLWQSFIFMCLQMVRDENFDKIPSFSVAGFEESKKMDISYYELKELQRTLGKHTTEGQARLSTEFINEYGKIRVNFVNKLVTDKHFVDIFVSSDLSQWIKFKAGVVTIKMVSEILLHLGSNPKNVRMLISYGVLTQLLNMKSSLINQSTQSLTPVKESLINIAQLGARMLIHTDPKLFKSHELDSICSLICRSLLSDDECHHELLQYEALLALTNVATIDSKSQLISIGVWSGAIQILIGTKMETLTQGQAQIVVAACELVSNLSLAE